MYFLHSFKEAYELALKAEERLKWSSYLKDESRKLALEKSKE